MESGPVRRRFRARPHLRADITGLRALAIIPVVAYHAGVPGFQGGFIGVDVFFVISGFLITGRLLHDVEARGRVHFGDFWAKRLRRLVPASSVMILLTLPIVLLFLPPFQWSNIGKQAVAALVFLSNVFFSRQTNDYFTADLALPDPYLHTWSLGVEEQFYVFWPVLIALVVWLALRTKAKPRVALAAAFGIIGVVSLAGSILLTPGHSQDAFYLLPTRAWEFAFAGIVALFRRDLIRSTRVRTALTGAGIAGIVALTILLPDSVGYPGWAAALPVVAALAVILGGMGPSTEARSVPTLALESPPLTWIGSVSYSWYLWHWPFIVLFPLALQSQSPWIPIVGALLALGVGALAYAFVENPVRFDVRLTRSIKRSFLAAGAFIVVVGLIAGGTFWQGRSAIAAETADAAPAPTAAATPGGQPPTTQSVECVKEEFSPSGIRECVFGDVDSPDVVVLTGDSHTRHYEAAMGEAAKRVGIKLVVRWMSACTATDVTTIMTTGSIKTGCAEYRADTNALIAEIKPLAVILSQAEAFEGRIVQADGTKDGSPLTTAQQDAAWSQAYDTWLTDTAKSTWQIAAVRDNPRMHSDPNICLQSPGGTPTKCAVPRADALDQIDELQQLSAAAQRAHAVYPIFSTTDRLCDFDTCQVEVDGIPVYKDSNHFTFAYAETLTPSLVDFLKETVATAKADRSAGTRPL